MPMFAFGPGSASSITASPANPGLISPSQSGYTSSPNLLVPAASSSERRGPVIPQKRYRPDTSIDRRRYVDEVKLEPSIYFYMQRPDEEGIPLRDALHNRSARLVARDEPMFQERGPSISVRILVSIAPHNFATLMNVLILFHSGRAISPGVVKSLLGTSATPQGLLRARNSQRTWPNAWSASSWYVSSPIIMITV
jgi:hypothetical protein